MALFEWKQEHSVSVSRFDTDHKKLFAILNELNDAMAERRGRLVVVRILQEMAEYARWHFAGEETAMRRALYEDIETHIAEHREFSAKVEEFYSECGQSHAALPIDVLYFLRNWLQKHILVTDRQYAESLNRAGIH
jgi:hemerythrin-like metal-binding protein